MKNGPHRVLVTSRFHLVGGVRL